MDTDPKTGYFADQNRKIHYVIVIKEENLPLLEKFIKNLNNIGVDTEISKGKKTYLFFVLFHLSKKAQVTYSKIYNIGREKEKSKYADAEILKGFHFKKLPKLPDKTEGQFTNAQCIIILNKILETTPYGNGEFEYSVSKLKNKHIIVDSYPLHDGPLNLHFNQFNEETVKTCNERELLYRYWASFRVWYHEIPLDLIKKYYGHEIAFYFHWLEYFNLMLFPIAILGLLVIITNVIILFYSKIYTLEDICNAGNMYVCPNCALKVFCYYKPLTEYCDLYQWTYIFDNYLTIIFAVLISLWDHMKLLYERLSHRIKHTYIIDKSAIAERMIRTLKERLFRREYAENITRKKLNSITGEIEPFLSPFQKLIRYTFVGVVCLLMLSLDILMIFAIFYFEMVLKMYIILSPLKFSRSEKKGSIMIAGCFLLVVMIKLNSKIIPIVARWLTKIEKPRYQKDYDNSLMYKRYILLFGNNYTVLFYTAFVKGVFYVTPNSPISSYIERDSCQPLACVLDLASKLFFIMLFRRLLWNILRMVFSALALPFKKNCTPLRRNIPQYEEEYRLQPTTRDFLYENYNEMIIEYGLVTFFAAAFPLAPLFALVDNLLEMRLSARKLIKKTRRPIPRVVPGIGPWEGVLLGLMYLSTAVNAFVIAFSTQFVSREVYRSKNNFQLKGFINYTLSEFATKDYDVYSTIKEKQDTCFYMGMRESPTSSNKYHLTTEFWANFTWRMVFLVVFEHIILMLNALLSFCIRDIPPIVRDHIAYDRESVREAQVKLTKEQEETMFMRFRGRSANN